MEIKHIYVRFLVSDKQQARWKHFYDELNQIKTLRTKKKTKQNIEKQ